MRWCITPNMSSQFCEKNEYLYPFQRILKWLHDFYIVFIKYNFLWSYLFQNMIFIQIYK